MSNKGRNFGAFFCFFLLPGLAFCSEAGFVLKISHTDLTWKHWASAVFEFNGKIYKNLDDLDDTFDYTQLRKGGKLSVLLPEEADLNDPSVKLFDNDVSFVGSWKNLGGSVVYYQHGKMIPQHVLVFRFDEKQRTFDRTELFLDGKSLGYGKVAAERLRARKLGNKVAVLLVKYYSEEPPFELTAFPWSMFENTKIKLVYSRHAPIPAGEE